MLTPDHIDTIADDILPLYDEFSQSVINDIARRLAKMPMTPTAAWQAQRLIESGKLYENVLQEIAALTGRSEKELAQLFKRAGVRSMRFDDSIYKAAGLNPLPLNLSPAMAGVLAAGLRKTNGLMRNLTMTTAQTAQQSFIAASDLAYLQVTSGAFDYNTAIRNAIKKVSGDGLSVIHFASGKVDQLDVAMRRAVLTGVSQTAGKLQWARADELGQDLVQVSAHGGARPSHALWQGKIYSRSGTDPKYPHFETETGYGTGAGLGGWNCVVGETMVSSLAKRAAYRREYSGELIIIRTAMGKELTVTPNHPILTDHGWVAAKFLNHGDYVICRRGLHGDFGISPNVDQSESRIEDVFNSLCVSGKRFNLPVSSCHFHGDISNGKVEIVFADGFLGDDTNVLTEQELIEIGFRPSSSFSYPFDTHGSLPQVGKSSFTSPNGSMSGFGEFGATMASSPVESLGHSLGAIVSNRDTDFAKINPNRSLGNSCFGGNLIFPHAGFVHGNQVSGGDVEFPFDVTAPVVTGINPLAPETVLNRMNRALILVRDELQGMVRQIQLDNIIRIERKSTQGSFIHVYNLQTEGEWYSANGIITHNCRHSYYPFFKGISKDAYDNAMRNEMNDKTVTLNGKQILMYEATQMQRSIERKIRFFKRQAYALEAAKQDASFEFAKVKQWQSRMRAFVKATKLDRQYAREQVIK